MASTMIIRILSMAIMGLSTDKVPLLHSSTTIPWPSRDHTSLRLHNNQYHITRNSNRTEGMSLLNIQWDMVLSRLLLLALLLHHLNIGLLRRRR